jgi:type IV pilus assembly protein PilN
MAKINLLPWRAERRAQRQKEFYGMLGLAAAAGILLSFLIWFYYGQQISGQNTRNQFLEQEIVKVKAQNEEIKTLGKQKDRLLARKKVIEQLQANRSQMVHLFDSLVRTIPDGVALASIKQEGEILTLEGRAQSNARVSAYMRNLEGSGWMTNPDLSIIEAKGPDKAGPGVVASDVRALPYVFTLQVKLANPNAPDEEGGVSPAVSPAVADSTAAASPSSSAPPVAPAAPATTAPSPATDTTKPAAAPAPAATPAVQPAPATQGSPAS